MMGVNSPATGSHFVCLWNCRRHGLSLLISHLSLPSLFLQSSISLSPSIYLSPFSFAFSFSLFPVCVFLSPRLSLLPCHLRGCLMCNLGCSPRHSERGEQRCPQYLCNKNNGCTAQPHRMHNCRCGQQIAAQSASGLPTAPVLFRHLLLSFNTISPLQVN